MQVHLKTLGCRLNEAELETWAQAFQKAGHQVTAQAEAAQLIVLNSCAVTHDAVRKSRQLIRRLHRDNPGAKLVVSGCYATLSPDEARSAYGVDLLVANQDKPRLVEKVLAELDFCAMPALSMDADGGGLPLRARGRQRAFVKVQDGCRYRCTFCIVTVARGEERSRPVAEIVDEINGLHRQGVQEVVLTGVHLGGYGGGGNGDLRLLVQAILDHTAIPRLRLGSLEPWALADGFLALFANRRLMPHLHLPLQSGSDSVLRRMARRCHTGGYAELVGRLRAAVADMNITTDIIVGFPGESEQEWRQTLEFVGQSGFGHVHIFTYSQRAGTKAASLPGQVPEPVKKQRSQQLHTLAAELKQAFMRRNIGQRPQVLWETDGGQPLVFGYTPNYLRVACPASPGLVLENQIMAAKLVAASDDYLLAEL